MEQSNLILMIELPSWGHQLLSLFSRRSFEKWAGMSLQSALQLKQIQSSLRESWVIGAKRYYGTDNRVRNQKTADFANAMKAQAKAVMQESSVLKEQQNRIGSQQFQSEAQYRPLVSYPLTQGQNTSIESQDNGNGADTHNFLDQHFDRLDKRRDALESMLFGSTELHAKHFASKPHSLTEFQEHSSIEPLSEKLKVAIQNALSDAAKPAPVQSQTSSKKKYLYLAPWPKQ